MRDPLRWSRWARPRFLVAGTLLWVAVAVAMGQRPEAKATGSAARAAAHVIGAALRLAQESTP